MFERRLPAGCRLILVGLLLATGCNVTVRHRFGNLKPNEQAAHAGTQTGFHRLSPYFAVSVSGGTIGNRTMEFCHFPDGGGRKKLIGMVTGFLLDGADYGARNQHFALSADGRQLLYFHEEALGYAHVRKPDGLYRYREGIGDALVRSGGQRVLTDAETAAWFARST